MLEILVLSLIFWHLFGILRLSGGSFMMMHNRRGFFSSTFVWSTVDQVVSLLLLFFIMGSKGCPEGYANIFVKPVILIMLTFLTLIFYKRRAPQVIVKIFYLIAILEVALIAFGDTPTVCLA